MASKMQKFCNLQIILFSLKFVGIAFVSSTLDLASASVVSSRVIAESSIILAKYFPFLQLYDRIPNIIFCTYMMLFYTHIDTDFHHWFELRFLTTNLHLHSLDICFVNVFNSFIPVIMLNSLGFKSYVLFGTHTLLDKSLRVLQVLKHLSNLKRNG